MEPFTLLALLSLGAAAGTLAGLLGIGGGVVIVPILFGILQTNAGIPPVHLMHIALGTSLSAIVLTSLSSVHAHHKHGGVQWSIVGQLAPWLMLGVFMGAMVADRVSSDGLRLFFGLFVLLTAIQLALNLQVHAHRQIPGRVGMGVVGLFIGQLSAFMGIGGGTLTIPFFLWCNVPVRQAVATSAAAAFPIAVSGAAGFIIAGWQVGDLPAWSSGYIYWPAFLGIAPISLLFAPLGVRLAHSLPVDLLKRIFAGYLAVMGVGMLLA